MQATAAAKSFFIFSCSSLLSECSPPDEAHTCRYYNICYHSPPRLSTAFSFLPQSFRIRVTFDTNPVAASHNFSRATVFSKNERYIFFRIAPCLSRHARLSKKYPTLSDGIISFERSVTTLRDEFPEHFAYRPRRPRKRDLPHRQASHIRKQVRDCHRFANRRQFP